MLIRAHAFSQVRTSNLLPELGQTDNKPVNRLTDKKHNHIRRHPTFISDVEPRDPRVRTYAPGAKGDGLPQEGTAAESKNKCTYVRIRFPCRCTGRNEGECPSLNENAQLGAQGGEARSRTRRPWAAGPAQPTACRCDVRNSRAQPGGLHGEGPPDRPLLRGRVPLGAPQV